MADLNDLSKPDGASNYQSEVWQTVRGHVLRLWQGDYTGMAGVVAGMRRWVTSAGGNIKLMQRNSSGTDDVVFDSSTKVDTSAINGLVRTAPIVAVAGNVIDCSAGMFFSKTLASSSGFSFTNVPSGVAYGFIFVVNMSGATAITWPSSVSWPSSTAPTLVANKKNIFQFLTYDGGLTWLGSSQTNY